MSGSRDIGPAIGVVPWTALDRSGTLPLRAVSCSKCGESQIRKVQRNARRGGAERASCSNAKRASEVETSFLTRPITVRDAIDEALDGRSRRTPCAATSATRAVASPSLNRVQGSSHDGSTVAKAIVLSSKATRIQRSVRILHYPSQLTCSPGKRGCQDTLARRTGALLPSTT